MRRADRDRLVEGEMRRMRAPAQRVEHEHLDAPQERQRRVRDAVAVGEVRKRPEPEPQDGPRAMLQRHRHDFLAADRKTAADRPELEVRHAAAFRRARLEDVAERPPQGVAASARPANTGIADRERTL